MVQSQTELIKLNSLFQKVLYTWLDCSQHYGFTIERDTPYLDLMINSNTLEFVSYRDNKLPSCSVSIRKIGSCLYDYWKMGVADYNLRSSICFYARNKLQFDFKRGNINTQDNEWNPYVSEIISQLNESQRFNLEFTLREVLQVLAKEIEFRKRISNSI